MNYVRSKKKPNFDKSGAFTVRVATVWGMEISLFTVLAVFVVLQGATILLTLFLASRGTGLVLDLFQELDEKLAGAIKGLVESGGIAGIEPVNPLQQAIAQMLIGKMQQELPQRAPNGQFQENIE